MTNHDLARRILAAGCPWVPGMRAVLHIGDVRYGDQFGGLHWRIGDESGASLLFLPADLMEMEADHKEHEPLSCFLLDLTDGPTLRACWDALVSAVEAKFPEYSWCSIKVGSLRTRSGERACSICIGTVAHHFDPAHTGRLSEPEALAEAWEWWAGVRDA